jgi:hypothetical protein
MNNNSIPEIDILIETSIWLFSNGWTLDTVSLARGQGIDGKEHKKKLYIRLLESKVEFPNHNSNGPDIIAKKDGLIWKIECKGLGEGVSQTLRNNFDRALSSTVSYYDQRNNLQIGLAMPRDSTYLGLIRSRIPQALREAINLWVILWNVEKKVIEAYSPNQNI